jgi:hypothetical protein
MMKSRGAGAGYGKTASTRATWNEERYITLRVIIWINGPPTAGFAGPQLGPDGEQSLNGRVLSQFLVD